MSIAKSTFVSKLLLEGEKGKFGDFQLFLGEIFIQSCGNPAGVLITFASRPRLPSIAPAMSSRDRDRSPVRRGERRSGQPRSDSKRAPPERRVFIS